MIYEPSITHVFRPLSDPLAPALAQRSRKVLEALEALAPVKGRPLRATQGRP